jgi:drug/metabolite transporter (DMT)-like permease
VSRRAWAALVVLGALWGGVYPLIEIILRDLGPVQVVLVRVSLAALLLVPLAIHRRALRRLWRQPRAIVETVLVQATIPMLLIAYGQRYVSSGLAGILFGAQPLFVAVLAVRYAPDERPRGWQGPTGMALGFAGVVLLFGTDLSGGRNALFGGVLLLASALCYAAGALMIHRRHGDAPPLGVTASALLVTAGVLAVPAGLSWPAQAVGTHTLAALVVLGFGCTGLTLLLFYTLVARIGPARAALSFYLSPGFAVAFGALFLGERVTVTAVLGLAAIVAGSILAAQRPAATRSPTEHVESAR